MNSKDKIHIKNLGIQTIVGPDLWSRLNLQKCKVSMNILTDFSKSSATDDLKYSLNYAVLCRDVTNFVNKKKNWNRLDNLSKSIFNFVSTKYHGINGMEVIVKNEDLHIRTKDIAYIVNDSLYDAVSITNLELFAIIGVFTFERFQKQKIVLDLNIQWPHDSHTNLEIKPIINNVVQYVENSNFKTVEALVGSVSKVIHQSMTSNSDNVEISVKVTKLNAITDTSGVGVSCIKNGKELSLLEPIEIFNDKTPLDSFNLPVNNNNLKTKINNTNRSTAFLAFGSNIGDRLSYISQAIDLLIQNENVKISSVSSLFESEPMYFEEQEPFLNGCIKITTKLTPHELLKLCKQIEYDQLKRVKDFDNGPRCIDLDIILYVDGTGNPVEVNDRDLIVPHPRMLERTFVLEPLCELIPPTFIHPVTTEPINNHLQQIYDLQNDQDILWKLVPIPDSVVSHKPRFLKFRTIDKFHDLTKTSKRITVSPTYIMSILNTTPDSFSDGINNFNDLEVQLNYVKEICNDVLKFYDDIIIDIGGCSTRPNSVQASVAEELERTIPLINAIRQSKDLPQDKIILSIDTYRSDVAKAAIESGVDIINDISGGSFDNKLFETVAQYPKVAYVLSHIRGDISTMTKLAEYNRDDEYILDDGVDFISGETCDVSVKSLNLSRIVGYEISKRYLKAIECGMKHWQIIIDPGLGFAKNMKENLDIIRQLPILKNYSYYNDASNNYVNFRNIPILLGPSRKGFIGSITQEDIPKDRDFVTGSLVASCIGYGTNIIRVHNAKECSKSAIMADTLYKEI